MQAGHLYRLAGGELVATCHVVEGNFVTYGEGVTLQPGVDADRGQLISFEELEITAEEFPLTDADRTELIRRFTEEVTA